MPGWLLFKKENGMTDFIIQIVPHILRITGLWFLFPKFNVKSYWALVPIANSYKLAQCADDEDSGAVWCFTNFLGYVFMGIEETLRTNGDHKGNTYYMLIMIISLMLVIINMIYMIRIFTELIHIFGRKKRWIIPWVLFENLLTFYWGISKKFEPVNAVSRDGVDESGTVAENLKEGLTININERSARRKLFLKKVMLKDIHMNIKPGKMVLLLGGSGAGKTTFINAVTGYEKADASILLNGTDVYKDFDKVIYEIGMVPQQELIRGTDTVFRTLMNAAALRMPSNVSKKDRIDRVNEVMEIFGLTPVKNNMISKQSGGQKKRISIATEYISDPALFILDEPDSGLDGILAKELMQKLHDISREGKIVIVVTHTPDRVIDLFDEVIVLAKDESRTGRLVFKGTVDEARKFFKVGTMEEIIKTINRPEEGGLGKADKLLKKFNKMSGEVTDNE